jgi:hypothetical protein
MRTQSIKFGEFMNDSWKLAKKKRTITKVATSVSVPMALTAPHVSFASSGGVVEAGATEWLGEKTLSTLAHALDPLVDIMVALSFPIASVAMLGGCFHFFFNNPEKAWSTMQNVGLGYVLIQLMPMILGVLKAVGGAV